MTHRVPSTVRAACALLLAILLLPLTGYPHIWPLQSALPDGLTILLAIALGATGLTRVRDDPLHLPVIGILLGAFLLSVALSGLLADEAGNAVGLRWQLVTLAALALSLIALGRLRAQLGNDGYIQLLTNGLVLCGGLYAVGSLFLQYAVPALLPSWPDPSSARLGGFWGQPNLTTSTLWLALFAGLYPAVLHGYRTVFFVGAFLLAVVAALAASRLNVLFLLLAAGLALSAWRLGTNPATRRQGRWLGLASALFVFCLVAVPPTARLLESSLGYADPSQATLIEREPQDRPRIIEHKKILAALPEWSFGKLLTGVGPGNYGAFSYELPVQPKNAAGSQVTWLHSHNLFSTILVEQGVIGLAVAVGILALVVIRLWRIRRQPYALPLAGALGVLFLHSNVEFPLWYPWFTFVFVGLALPLFDSVRVPVTSPRLLTLMAVLMLAFVGAFGANLGYQAWHIVDVAAARTPDREDRLRLRRLEHDGLMGPYATLVKYRQFSPSSLALEEQLEQARRTAAWRPLDLVKVRQTMLLVMAGRGNTACEAARRTTERYPAAGPILAQKVIAASMRADVELARFMGCIEAGLEPWGIDLATMQQRNQQRIDDMLEGRGNARE